MQIVYCVSFYDIHSGCSICIYCWYCKSFEIEGVYHYLYHNRYCSFYCGCMLSNAKKNIFLLSLLAVMDFSKLGSVKCRAQHGLDVPYKLWYITGCLSKSPGIRCLRFDRLRFLQTILCYI